MKLKQKIYRAMDSFLVEAKDKRGTERSLERLNKDRHLFVKRMEALFREERKKVYQEAIKLFKKFKNEPMTGNVVILELRGLMYRFNKKRIDLGEVGG